MTFVGIHGLPFLPVGLDLFVEAMLVRIDVRVHEREQALPQFLHLGAVFEVHAISLSVFFLRCHPGEGRDPFTDRSTRVPAVRRDDRSKRLARAVLKAPARPCP